jgi:predicted transcriptional regulator
MTRKYMSRYRNRIDIIAQLLEAARGGTAKTKMKNKAMVSDVQLKEYLQMLIENDLIVYDKTSQTFTTTHKGHQFLKGYEDLTKLFTPIKDRSFSKS